MRASDESSPPEIDEKVAPSISALGLTKRFGKVAAVRDLSFEVRPGVVTGFLGPNGAGKSTTLRMILGLVAPTSGSATVLGRPYASLPAPARSVGAVLETQSFNPLRTGRNHLRVLASAAGIPLPRADEVLEEVGLAGAARRAAGKYSLGMRQRLALGAALLGDPTVLILDEPANGLDPQGIRWLRGLLREFAADGNTVLVSSHVLTEMADLADEAIVINKGRLVRQAPVASLTNASRELRVLSPENDRLEVALRGRGLSVRSDGDGALRVRGAEAPAVGTIAFEAGLPLYGLSEEHASLEDVFFQLTGEEESS
jgi:ABC-2 type transport system ATP-binding protein